MSLICWVNVVIVLRWLRWRGKLGRRWWEGTQRGRKKGRRWHIVGIITIIFHPLGLVIAHSNSHTSSTTFLLLVSIYFSTVSLSLYNVRCVGIGLGLTIEQNLALFIWFTIVTHYRVSCKVEVGLWPCRLWHFYGCFYFGSSSFEIFYFGPLSLLSFLKWFLLPSF